MSDELLTTVELTFPHVKLRNLAFLAIAPGFTHWHYRAESIIEVLNTGYWDPARTIGPNGPQPMDQITITAPDGAVFGVFGVQPTGALQVAWLAHTTAVLLPPGFSRQSHWDHRAPGDWTEPKAEAKQPKATQTGPTEPTEQPHD